MEARIGSEIANKILLIGWDAADWQHINPLLEKGLLPGLESLINRGVMGNLATLHPVLSPMLWNSVATGKTADKHGVLGFTQPRASGKGLQPFSSKNRQAKAIWNICHQNGLKSNVIGWWASHPAEPIDGCIVTNLFNGISRQPDGTLQVAPGTFHPSEKAKELAQLKVHASEITAADILPFIPLAGDIDQESDVRLATACKLLSDCASIQSVATHLIENEPWDLTALYFDSIDHFCHAFMYYHPPKMRIVKPEDFEIYKDVINGAYRFHDMILQRLMYLAGDDTTIILCSDHGFQSGKLRPVATPSEPAGPAAWHRELGVFVMAGPGVRQDERIYGANIIDITPTILYQLGLPVGEDMDGRVLIDAFENPSPPQTIPSWEDINEPCGQHPGATSIDVDPASDEQAQDLVKQFVALGYIEDPGDDLEKAARNCQLELDYNLARVYLSTNRLEKAVEILTELVSRMPWEDRYWKNLAHCYFELGYIRQAQKIMESLYRDTKKPPVFSRVFLAKTCFELNEYDQAKEYLDVAMALNPKQPMIYVMAGRTLIRNDQLVDAEQFFNRALENDEDCAYAWVGLAEVHSRLNRHEAAADAALSALAILYRIEKAHWILGVAMMKMRQWDRARQAFDTLLKFHATRYKVGCHRNLKQIYRELENNNQADLHAQMARDSLIARRPIKKQSASRREELLELPVVPTVKERIETYRQERPRPHGGQQVKAEPGSSGRTLTLVSGLPRSGTSLMMQMLAAGGLPAKSDGLRVADQDNPQGYLEWEAIKQLPKLPELFDDESLDSLAIKVISMLLTALPRKHRYKVIFMSRNVNEIADSQAAMISRLGADRVANDVPQITSKLERHREEILQWLRTRKFIELLVVEYSELIADPQSTVSSVREFVGVDRLPLACDMSHVVRPELYRQKVSKNVSEADDSH